MAGTFILSGGGTPVVAGTGDHWTDLANYTDSLRNIVARPGTFLDLFPETTDDHLVAVLQDGLAECHLEQVLLNYESDDMGLVHPEMLSGETAMVVLYAGLRLLKAELFNRTTSAKYVAGPVSAETTQATNILRDIMKGLQEQKDRITKMLSTAGAGAAFVMADSYMACAFNWPPNNVPLADWLPVRSWSWI